MTIANMVELRELIKYSKQNIESILPKDIRKYEYSIINVVYGMLENMTSTNNAVMIEVDTNKCIFTVGLEGVLNIGQDEFANKLHSSFTCSKVGLISIIHNGVRTTGTYNESVKDEDLVKTDKVDEDFNRVIVSIVPDIEILDLKSVFIKDIFDILGVVSNELTSNNVLNAINVTNLIMD